MVRQVAGRPRPRTARCACLTAALAPALAFAARTARAQPPARPDSAAARSPDGALVAYVRDTPGDSVAGATGAVPRTELWVANPDGAGARRLLRGRDAAAPERTLAGLTSPAFSPGGRRVYVLSDGWVTSGALHAVDVATGTERFVAPANGFEVLRRGPLAGYLLVTQHRYFPAGEGSYEGVVLVAPEGRVRGFVTDEDAPEAAARLAAVRAGRMPALRPFPQRAPAGNLGHG